MFMDEYGTHASVTATPNSSKMGLRSTWEPRGPEETEATNQTTYEPIPQPPGLPVLGELFEVASQTRIIAERRAGADQSEKQDLLGYMPLSSYF